MASIPKWTIEFDPAAQREFDRLDNTVARRISKFLYQRVAYLDDPHQIGERLQGTLSRTGNIASATTESFVHSNMTGSWYSFSASATGEKSTIAKRILCVSVVN
jgi:hypothetical protein